MLKTIILSQVLGINKVLIARMLVANKVGGVEGDDKLIEKYGKLSKTRKLSKGLKSSKLRNLKSEKLSKFQKSAKLKRKLSKSGNSPIFDAKKNRPSFLTPKVRAVFNRLWLVFTKTPIFQHFDPKYHIWIKIDVSSYTISVMLSKLASKIRSDMVVTKTNLGQ